MWPFGQAGMGPLLGKCRHTGHSTMLLMSPTRLLSLAASSGGFFFDLLFVFAVCLFSVFGSIFGFFFAGLDKIERSGAGFDTSLIGRGWVSQWGWVERKGLVKLRGFEEGTPSRASWPDPPGSETLLLLADMLPIQQTLRHWEQYKKISTSFLKKVKFDTYWP